MMTRKTDMDAAVDKLAREGDVQVASQTPWDKSKTRRKRHDTRLHEKGRKKRQLRPAPIKLIRGTGE
jgi:hypothetical protein